MNEMKCSALNAQLDTASPRLLEGPPLKICGNILI